MLVGVGIVELMGGLREKSFNGMIETKINLQCIQEYLGRLSMDISFLRKEREQEMTRVAGSEEMC